MLYQGLIYRLLKEKSTCNSTKHLAKINFKIVNILNMHNAVQTAAVTIISHKPRSNLILLGTHNTIAFACPLLQSQQGLFTHGTLNMQCHKATQS